MQTLAQISETATREIKEFVTKATSVQELSNDQLQSAFFLVLQACEQCRMTFALSPWHSSQPVHAFEALMCEWKGQNHRWPPLSINLHYTVKPDGSLWIATPEELPLARNYWVRRAINDARFFSPVGD